MKKSLLYTATGDDGTTSLVGGSRALKDSPRLEAYGTVDELNSFIGLFVSAWVTSFGPGDPVLAVLIDIQNRLFDLGAYLATPADGPSQCNGIDATAVAAIEHAIDEIDAMVPPMRCFVLPGGTRVASLAHVCRTVARRAERRILTLRATLTSPVTLDPMALKYVNRLSDLFFAMARSANHRLGVPDLPWNPA